MSQNEYAIEIEEISAAAGILADEIEAKNYEVEGGWDELKRDIARSIELWQRRVEVLADILRNEYPDYASPFGGL
jgi:hypothetical protein